MLREAFRILKPGGSLILTWPQQIVDPILKFFTRLGMVAAELGLEEHQKRIPLADLRGLLTRVGFARFYHRRFELGLNNLLVAEKSAEAGIQAAPGTGVALTLSDQRDSRIKEGGD